MLGSSADLFLEGAAPTGGRPAALAPVGAGVAARQVWRSTRRRPGSVAQGGAPPAGGLAVPRGMLPPGRGQTGPSTLPDLLRARGTLRSGAAFGRDGVPAELLAFMDAAPFWRQCSGPFARGCGGARLGRQSSRPGSRAPWCASRSRTATSGPWQTGARLALRVACTSGARHRHCANVGSVIVSLIRKASECLVSLGVHVAFDTVQRFLPSRRPAASAWGPAPSRGSSSARSHRPLRAPGPGRPGDRCSPTSSRGPAGRALRPPWHRMQSCSTKWPPARPDAGALTVCPCVGWRKSPSFASILSHCGPTTCGSFAPAGGRRSAVAPKWKRFCWGSA